MKKLKEFLPLKILAVILLGISIFTIPVGIIWGEHIWSTVMKYNQDNFLVENYTQTSEFEGLVNTRVGQLEEYIRLKKILETNGKLDYNKIVVSTNELDESQKQEYTIKELMALNDFYVEDVYPTNNTTLKELFEEKRSEVTLREVAYGNTTTSVSTTAESINEIDYYQYKYTNGYIQILPGNYSEIDFVVNFLDKDDYIIVEDRAEALSKVKELWSVNNEEVSEVTIEEKEMLNGEIIEVYDINDIAYRFTYYVSFYTFYEELFKEGNTNFNYWIYIPEGTLTNLPKDKIDNSDNMLESIKESGGKFITYDPDGYQLETSLSYVNRNNIKGIEATLIGDEDKEFRLGIEVPSSFDYAHIGDEFAVEEATYKEGKLHIQILAISVIGAVIITIASSGYLISAVGHKKGVEGIALTGFDHIYSEIAAIILILLGGIVCVPLFVILDSYRITEVYVIIIIALTFIVEYIIFFIGMASLTRRIKAKTLWKDSICGRFIGSIRKKIKKLIKNLSVVFREFFLQRNVTTKVVIVYGAWVLSLFMILFIMLVPRSSFLAFAGLLLLIGGNLAVLYFLVKMVNDYQKIISGTERIAGGEINYKISDKKLNGENKRLVEAINNITSGLAQAIESSIKNERMKTDLITNVSHDIKTPLTSIINYVDLLKRENIEDEKIKSYLEVLDNKSQRLKTLTEDLVEASKLSSGNMEFIMEKINLVELVTQVNGEFIEKFTDRNLTIIPNLPGEPLIIKADGRRVWRVLENLYNNASKYSMDGTRVYIDLVVKEKRAFFSIKNISEIQLNIKAEELTERFIRGESSRTTEGSGLGLSIASSLTELMDGSFEIYLDGDLFRVTVSFSLV